MTSVAMNRKRGLIAEEAACERWPARQLTDTPDDLEWADIEFLEDTRTPIGRVRGGTWGEVKSCIPEYDDCKGKWWIRRRNHQRLLDEDGVYVMAVVDPDVLDVHRLAIVEARVVDDLINETWWQCGNGGHGAEEFRQLPWTTLFTTLTPPEGEDVVDRGLDVLEAAEVVAGD